MKLWTKELEEKAKDYPFMSQDGKGMKAKVLVKYFNPYGAGTWIATEAEKTIRRRLDIFRLLPHFRMGMGLLCIV